VIRKGGLREEEEKETDDPSLARAITQIGQVHPQRRWCYKEREGGSGERRSKKKEGKVHSGREFSFERRCKNGPKKVGRRRVCYETTESLRQCPVGRKGRRADSSFSFGKKREKEGREKVIKMSVRAEGNDG